MAVTFDEFVKRVTELPEWLKKNEAKYLLKHDKEIVSFSNEQLLKGKNTKDETMQTGYSKQYGKRRLKKGLQIKYVDLKFTGKYQDTKKLVKYDYGVDIRSAADYEAYLRSRFPDHVGLNEKNAEIMAQIISEEIAPEIKKMLIA